MVKETVDLKPIGTIQDPEFDLYIKKIDCQIVLEPPQPITNNFPQNDHYGNVPAHSSSNHYYQVPPVNSGCFSFWHLTVGQTKWHVSDHQGNDQGVIQTLVSIASGPNSVLHPSLDILVSGDSLGPHQDNNIPQFGGVYHDHNVDHHYGQGRPYLPEHHDPDHAVRPPQRPDFTPFGNYAGGFTIDRRKYESSQHSSFESESYGWELWLS